MNQDALDKFLAENRISGEQWDACNLNWEELESIGTDYEKEIPHLEATAALLANIIQKFDAVHSVRWRVKDKNHLLSKIVRKCVERNEKYIGISVDNYSGIVTDLIGLRAIHLFKDDFSLIDKFVIDTFELKDKPVVYIREGDDATFSRQCEEMGFQVELHPKGYRSIHYVIKTQPLKQRINVELQVRTIFEEGWSEIDHMVRYPNYSDDAHLAYLLTIFNRMAGSADEMGRFVRTLADELNEVKARLNSAVREKNESLAKVGALVEQLAAVKDGKNDNEKILALQAELENLKATQGATKLTSSHEDLLSKWVVMSSPIASRNLKGVDVVGELKSVREGLDVTGGLKSIREGLDVTGGLKSIREGLDVTGGLKSIREDLDVTRGLKSIREGLDVTGGLKSIREGLDVTGGLKSVRKVVDAPRGLKLNRKGVGAPQELKSIRDVFDAPGELKSNRKRRKE